MRFYRPEEYRDWCIEQYDKYRQKILSLIPNARVEHIGASSIEGAVSKGDLDIFVGVEQMSFDESVRLFTSLGFHEKQDTLRTDELCMLEADDESGVSFQVVANGSEFEFFLEFRDKLTNSQELLSSYNELKRSCSGLDEDKYRVRKSEFIERILAEKEPD